MNQTEQIIGFPNPGNLCYLNCLLQCLLHLQTWQHHDWTGIEKRIEQNKERMEQKEHPGVTEIIRLSKLWKHNRECKSPTCRLLHLYKQMPIRIRNLLVDRSELWNQQDSHDMFLRILNMLSGDDRTKTLSEEFRVKTSLTITCGKCGHSPDVKIESEYNLTDISDIVDPYINRDYRCEKCNLSGFCLFDRVVCSSARVLCMTRYTNSEMRDSLQIGDKIYMLKNVVCNSGGDRGHNYAVITNKEKYIVNDNNVSVYSSPRWPPQNAVILFYEQVSKTRKK